MKSEDMKSEQREIVASEQSAVSRRSFVELAVGAITMLPAVAGGFALTYAPEQAHADDSVSPATTVVIAKPNEAGFAVVDVTDGKRVPVPGASITITSNENKKVITGKTGSNGLFVADLSKITEGKKNANGITVYSAEISLALDKDGYRSFETGWMSIKGGCGYDVPTCKVGSEMAYPKRVTFSDWDVLYTNNEFAVTPANDETHEISVVLCSKTEAEVAVSIVAVGKNMIVASGKAKTSTTKQNGFFQAKIPIKGAFLMKNHGNALYVGDRYRLDYTVGGQYSYSVPLRMKITATPTALTAPFAKKMSFAPFGDATMKLSFRMPSWSPFAAGQEVQLWKPDLPIDVCLDPYGYMRASIRTPEWGYKSKNGKVEGGGDAWKKLPRKSFFDQYETAKSEMASYAMKTGAFMVNDSRSTFDAFEKSKTLKVAFSAEGAIAGRWSDESNAFRAKGEIRGILTIAFSIAKQLFAGPFPIVVQFDLNTHASIGVGCGIIAPYIVEKGADWSAWEYDFASTGVNFTLRIAPALSAGVGIKGVASFSLQGSLAFTVFVSAGPLPKGGKESNPHAIVGLSAAVKVIIQLLFFTMPITLWKHDWPKLYDSWDPDKLYAQSDPMAVLLAQSDDSWLDAQAMELGVGLAEMEGDGVVLDVLPVEGPVLSTQSSPEANSSQFQVKTVDLSTDDGLAYRITTFSTAADQESGSAVAPSGAGGPLMAGSSPALTTQGETSDTQNQAPAATVGDYKNYGKHDYATEKITNAESYLQLGDKAGLVPGRRQCIAKNVLSDPRVKIVSVYGKAVMFRIAAVMVKGKVRTRIVGQKLQTTSEPAGPICVFDFDPGIRKDPTKDYSASNLVDRNDLWDYDFDVTVLSNWDNAYQSIQFFVISGVREEKATLGQAATDVVFQHARFDVRSPSFSPGSWQVYGKAHGVTASSFALKFASTGTWYHNFSCPHIQFAEDNYENKENPRKRGTVTPHEEMLFTFLIRSAQSPDKVMSNKAGDGVRVSIGLCSADIIASDNDWSKFLMFDLSDLTGDLNDPTVYELTCSKRFRKDYHSGWNIVSLRGVQNAYHYSLLTTVFHAEGTGDNFKNHRTRVLEAKLWKKCAADGYLDDKDDKDLLRFVDWPNHPNQFLASIDGKLQKAEFSNGTLTPAYTEIGPSNFAISSFGLDSSGTILYYPTVCEGSPGYTYETSNGTKDVASKPMPAVNQHRIMACRMRNGKFSDPFVFAEVDYDMDNLALANVASDSIGFVSTNVIDAENGKADLYYTALPFVKCANIIGCEAVSTFAYPGSEVIFDLTVRNDGNTYITGFTAQIMEKGGKPQGSKKLVFSKDTLRESNYNPSQDGKLQDVEDDYALAPGKTSVYRISLTIPQSWSGTKSVCVKSTDVVMAPVNVASGSAVKTAPVLSTQADAGEADSADPSADSGNSQGGVDSDDGYWVDGDSLETYGYDDAGAYEYVVGTNGSDYDDEDGEPYDLLNVEGENSFFDDDDYDDRDSSDGYDGDDGDYDLALGEPKIVEIGRNTSTVPAPWRSTIPKTGDSLVPLTGLLGATTVAGAAMVAYSARRMANERNQGDDA